MARFTALQSRDFRLLLGGQLISLTGSQMQQVGVVWQLYLISRSPLALGLLGFFRVAPVLLFALGGGVVADALDRRRLMLVSQLALAAVSVALAVITHLGLISDTAIYGLAFVAGIATAFDGPARQGLLPRLVPAEDLANAISLHATVWEAATISGPAIAGVILAKWGVTPIYFADATSFLAVIGALLAMKHRGKSDAAQINLKAALEGLRFLRSSPLIFSTMLLDFAATFLGGSMLLMPIFADQILGVGAKGLGVLYAAQPAGAVITGLALSALPPLKKQGRILLYSVAAYGISIAAFGWSSHFILSLLALAASGAADTVSMVIRQTLRQKLTPDRLRGRMTSVNMIFFLGGPQLGEVEAGAVAKLFTASVSVWSGGLLCVAAAAMAAWVKPLRDYEE